MGKARTLAETVSAGGAAAYAMLATVDPLDPPSLDDVIAQLPTLAWADEAQA